MKQTLRDRVLNCPTLPSFPAVALEVLRLTQDQESDAAKLAAVMSSDAALTSRLLRTVNSSFYGHDHEISSVQHAVTILGVDSVKVLVLGMSLLRDLRRIRTAGFNPLRFWQRSIYAATAARVVAMRGKVNPETVFNAALLMDIGMLVLDQVLGGDVYADAIKGARSHGEVAELERIALGMTHEDVAALLAEHWNLPDALAVPMGNHHREGAVENPVHRRLTEVIALAGRCADIFVDASAVWSIADVRRLCMQRYNIDQISADAMLCTISQRTRELAPLFEINLAGSAGGGGGGDYETILERANRQLATMTVQSQQEIDRRRASRVKRQYTTNILLCPDGKLGQTTEVKIDNVSPRGIGFVHRHLIPKGTQFVMEMPQRQGRPMRLLFEVVRCHAAPKTGFVVGAELQCILSDEDPVGAPAVEQSVDDIRHAMFS